MVATNRNACKDFAALGPDGLAHEIGRLRSLRSSLSDQGSRDMVDAWLADAESVAAKLRRETIFEPVISRGTIDLIKSRIDLADLVGSYGHQLTRSGRNLKTCCPFHQESTPSFVIYEDGHFHCFGCNEHGDALSFVMQAEGVDFLPAVGILAGQANVDMDTPTKARRVEAPRRDDHHDHTPRVNDDDDDQSPLDLSTLPEPAPTPEVVEGFIPEGFPSNLYADSGQGKSYVGLHLSCCLIEGKPFLGRDVKQGKVLYLDWELESTMQRRRWGEVCRGAGLNNPAAGLYYRRMRAPLAEALDEIQRWQDHLKPVLTIIDSAGKAIGGDPIDHARIIRFYDCLDRLGTCLVIDHQPKPGGESNYSSKWEFGSSYKRHLARSSWQLERVGDNDGTIGLVLRHKKTNFGRLSADIHATMQFDQNEDGLGVVKLSSSDGVTAVSGKTFGLRGSIIEALREEALTAEGLAVALDSQDTGSIRNALTELKRSGLVAAVGKDGRAVVYGLADEHHHDHYPSEGDGDDRQEPPVPFPAREHSRICHTCKGTKWHPRADGSGLVCSTCHPPAAEGVA